MMVGKEKNICILTFVLVKVTIQAYKSIDGGEKMTQVNKILNMAKNNKGIVTAAMITQENISNGILKYLCDNGKLEKTARGIYILPDFGEDKFLNLQLRFKKGVFSHETALFLHNLIDRTPLKFHMTFPTNYNLTMAKKHNILCHQNKLDVYNKGIICKKTSIGNDVNVYCIEKTLCDILTPRSKTDIQIITSAFKRYKDYNQKNIPLLLQYAYELKVETKIRAYLEVLL